MKRITNCETRKNLEWGSIEEILWYKLGRVNMWEAATVKDTICCILSNINKDRGSDEVLVQSKLTA